MTQRLHDILSLIAPEAACIADVGYDHGKLILLLAQSFRNAHIIGVEQQLPAAERFWGRYAQQGLSRDQIELLHGDGLAPLRGKAVDTIVLAGLGERRMVEILSRDPDVVAGCRTLIFAPLEPQATLRSYLRSIGWSVRSERLSRRKDQFYPVYAAAPGVGALSETELIGPGLFVDRHPLLPAFLAQLKRRYEPLVAQCGPEQERVRNFYRAIERAIELSGGERGRHAG